MSLNQRLRWGAVIALVCLFSFCVETFAAPAVIQEPAVQQLLKSGMDALFNLDYAKAWDDFQKVKQLKPDTPLGEIFESEFYWWRIFNSTGDFYNLDYIDALKTKRSDFDDKFINTMEKAFAKADEYLKNHPQDAEAYFHVGMSNALRSRLEAGRDHTFAVVKYVKKSREYLDRCMQLDPKFKDAYLGLGAYNYYVEEYGGIYKPLRFLIRLPSGDRQQGIQQLQEASQLDGFVSTEAKFFLVSIYLRDTQKRYAEAEKMLHDLTEKYPNNPIFRFALGHAQKLQHQYDSARENFKKVAAHRETPGLGDLAIQVRKELESLDPKGSSLGRGPDPVSGSNELSRLDPNAGAKRSYPRP
ncbi:MAG: tetratricopeptide repeat protein [Terriglobia bacterium]